MNLKSVVGGDRAILAECERGEESAIELIKRCLRRNLPPNVLPVAKHQFMEIKRSFERLRELDKAA
jgi:hypothetical protein